MTVTLRPTVETHVWELAETMRPIDVLEVSLTREGTTYQVLQESVKCSQDVRTAVDAEGRVISIFGCSFGVGYAFPWMLSSPLVSQHGREAVSLARQIVRVWLHVAYKQGTPMLCNYIYRENTSARRYVQALGFTIFQSPGRGPFDFFYQLCASQPQSY